MWQKRRWRYLLLRIDNLPRNSAYVEAVSLDEELAAAAAEHKGEARRGRTVRMRDWSPELEMATVMADRLGDAIQAIIAVQGGKPPRISPLPRPRTAVEKLTGPEAQARKVLARVRLTRADGTTYSPLDRRG